jgi:hypothetical protein
MVGDAAMDAARDAAGDADTDDADTDGGDTDGGDTDGGDGGGGEFSSTLALTTAQEVPPCAAAGAGAMGAGTITLDDANTMIDVMITFEDLSAAPVAGHIHSGAPGVAGPIVLPFTDLTSPIMETFTETDYPATPPAGAPPNWDAFVALMRAGGTYVNLHTDACPPGEIRDQIE